MQIDTIISQVVTALAICGPAITWIYQYCSKQFKACEEEKRDLSIRVAALEGGDFPRCIRTIDGKIISINSPFIAFVGVPLGLTKAEHFIGKTFDEVFQAHNASLNDDLKSLHNQLTAGRTYATSCAVRLQQNVKATVVKMISNSPTGPVYVSIIVPQV